MKKIILLSAIFGMLIGSALADELSEAIAAARIDFNERYLTLKQSDMGRIRLLLKKAGENYNVPNPDAHVRDKLNQIATTEDIAVVEAWVSQLEAKVTELNGEEAAEKAERAAIEGQFKDMAFGKKLYAIVQVKNKLKGLTKAQRRQMRADLKEIRDDLTDGSICEARGDISALTPDGVIINAEDIADIISRIDEYKTCL